MNVSNLTTPETILDFWFGSTPDDTVAAKERADLWWSKNTATDDEIRRRFEIYVILRSFGTTQGLAVKSARPPCTDHSHGSISAQHLSRHRPGFFLR
jgi:uncharacterized protein (DUF924 family)